MKKLIYLCLILSVVVLSCGEADLTAPSPDLDNLVGGELFKTSRFRATSAEFEVSLFAFGFNQPQGMAFGQQDGLFVADQGTGEIKVVIPGNNTGVPPFAFGLDRPIKIAFHGPDLFTTEIGSNEVTKVKPGDNSTTPPLISGLNGPTYLAFKGDFLFVNELRGSVGEKITAFLIENGTVVNSKTIVTYPDNVNNNPEGMQFLGSNLFVCEQITGVVKAFELIPGSLPIDAGSVPPFVTGLSNPTGLAFAAKVNKLYAAGDPDLYEIDSHGNARVIATGLTGTFNDVVVHKSGVLFVSNNGAGEIWKVVRL